MDFLQQSYLGNTLERWLVSLVIIGLSLILAKFLFWFFARFARRLTAKTRNVFDDILVDTTEKPAIFIVTLMGLWFGLTRLNLSDPIREWIDLGVEFVFVLVVAWMAARFFDGLFQTYIVPLAARSQTDLDDHILPVAQKAVKTIIWTIGIVVALDNAGHNVGALLAGIGIGGLALAMAAKDTVSNVFGGFTIFVDKPFRLKDRVRAAGHDGYVREIGLRSTRLETMAGTQVTVPNSKFSDTVVENVSKEPSRKTAVVLGLTYDTTPKQMEEALAILQRICEQNEGVAKAAAYFTEFGDFSLNVKLTYYIKKEADISSTQSHVNMAILTQFNQQGLDFAFPTQTLYTKPIN